MNILRHTHTIRATGGKGDPNTHATCLTPFIGRSCYYIIAQSLTELGSFAKQSSIKSTGYSSPDWDFKLGLEKAIDYCFTGDTSAVAESDALLARMEEHIQMPSTRAHWESAVAGAFPDIPAFLSGQPLNMRMRTKVQTESAPIAIMVDLGISGGISAQQVRNRGIAILALTRALAAHRPVELWALDFGAADEGGSSFGRSSKSNAVCVAAKIETSPLDLAAASYALTHPAFVRQVLFGLETHYHDFVGGWPFSLGRALTRMEMEMLLRPVFTHVQETLALPGLHLADQSMNDPEGWLRKQLAEHDPLVLDQA